MHPHRLSTFAAAWLTLLLAAPWLTLAADPKPMERKNLSPAEQRELQTLLNDFRRVRGDVEQRQEVLDKIGPLGPTALRAAQEIVEKELHKAFAEYRPLFGRSAAALIAEKGAAKNVQEIGELRQKVRELSQHDALTKQQITDIADPAVARLKDLILVRREDVLDHGKALAAPREKLLALGQTWDHCQKLLQEAQPASPAAAASEAPPASAPKPFVDYLVQDEELTLTLAMPMDPATRGVLSANAALAAKLDPEEARCILDCNLTRCLLGLQALEIDPALVAASRGHSADMEKLNFFAHDSPVPGRTTPWDRAKLVGTSASAENIAAGHADGVSASRGWWHSPGHHKNMLGEHRRIGVGRSGALWTEMFGG